MSATDWLEVVATAGVEFEDERVRYVGVQIDRDDWLEARRLWGSTDGRLRPDGPLLLQLVGDVVAERHRYRAALQLIAGKLPMDCPDRCPEKYPSCHRAAWCWRCIAREALVS